MDEIQADLLRWTDGDRRAGLRVVRALTAEWSRPIRAMIRADEGRIEDVLQEMVVRLVLPKGSKPPRALAPPHVTNAKAWRRTVLKNAVVSWIRHEATHERAEHAFRHDLDRAAVRALEDRRRDGPVALTVVPPDSESPLEALENLDELTTRRETVLRLLPKVAVRRRVAIALVLGIDPIAWVEPLAAALKEDPGDVAARMAAALNGGEAYRVTHPEGDGEESFRKALERGVEDLRRLLAEEEP